MLSQRLVSSYRKCEWPRSSNWTWLSWSLSMFLLFGMCRYESLLSFLSLSSSRFLPFSVSSSLSYSSLSPPPFPSIHLPISLFFQKSFWSLFFFSFSLQGIRSGGYECKEINCNQSESNGSIKISIRFVQSWKMSQVKKDGFDKNQARAWYFIPFNFWYSKFLHDSDVTPVDSFMSHLWSMTNPHPVDAHIVIPVEVSLTSYPVSRILSFMSWFQLTFLSSFIWDPFV